MPDNPSKPARVDVFISSTIIDLPAYREAVSDAIISLGLHPSGLERWPVGGKNSVELCKRMVEEAEIYIGVYAHRYGWRPEGDGTRSITEMEYDWAGEVKRDGKPIPRLCFIVKDNYPWPSDEIEIEANIDLKRFKAKVKANHAGFFTTPDDLKAQVLLALADHAHRHGLRTLNPYLRWLHEQSKKSGLLHVLTPRDVGANGDTGTVTVDQVYTPLDTRQTVYRTKDGKLLLSNPNPEAAELKREGEELEQSPLTAMEAADLMPRLVLLGDPGSGKSTFVGYLALSLSGALLDHDSEWYGHLQTQGWSHGEKLPILVTLRDFAQDVKDEKGSAAQIYDHIERELRKWNLAEAFPALQTALDDGRAMVMFDGLDEVPSEKRELVRDAVTHFMTRCHEGNRYIITCRILSYTNPEWHIRGTTSQTIAPFDQYKIQHFVRAWYTALTTVRDIDPQTAQARVNDLSTALNDPKLLNVSENPMLLTVMVIVHNHTGALPRESARLYQECVRLLMLKWRPHAATALQDELGVREDELYRILYQIAFEAHSQQADREGTADISEADVVKIAADMLNGDLNKAKLFCEYVENRAGLLYGRGSAGRWRVFTFPHRTFQEYLAGCYVANNTFWDFAPELARKLGWREALLLATGHLVFNQQRIDVPMLAIDGMVAEDAETEDDWRAVWLAGEMLALVGVNAAKNDKRGKRLLKRVPEQLVALIEGRHLPPVERAGAGRALGVLGDLRLGVGVTTIEDADSLIPDIVWCEIPAGPFLMGSDKDKDPNADDDETPQREVNIPYTYWMAKYPVTYAQYEPFVNSDGYTNRDYWTDAGWEWKGDKTHPEAYWYDPQWHIANHPVVGVTWYEAYAYTRWLNALHQTDPASPLLPLAMRDKNPQDSEGMEGEGYEIRLSTETEWEKAVRGTDGLIFPYGNVGDLNKGNYDETGLGRTSAVGLFPDDASPYGVQDASGNVLDWLLVKWRENFSEAEDNDSTEEFIQELRGGFWLGSLIAARSANRIHEHSSSWFNDTGFRVCAVPITTDH